MVEPLVAEGLKEFRRDLRKIDPRMGKALQVAHKRIAEGRAAEGRAAMESSPYKQARGAGGYKGGAAGIRPRARQTSSSIALLGGNKFVRALEFGTRYHYLRGWRDASSFTRRVFPPWVGNQFSGGDWKDGLHGKSGHFVQPAIQRWIDSAGALDDLEAAYDWAFREAYPERLT